jgi:hypothetical protein
MSGSLTPDLGLALASLFVIPEGDLLSAFHLCPTPDRSQVSLSRLTKAWVPHSRQPHRRGCGQNKPHPHNPPLYATSRRVPSLPPCPLCESRPNPPQPPGSQPTPPKIPQNRKRNSRRRHTRDNPPRQPHRGHALTPDRTPIPPRHPDHCKRHQQHHQQVLRHGRV